MKYAIWHGFGFWRPSLLPSLACLAAIDCEAGNSDAVGVAIVEGGRICALQSGKKVPWVPCSRPVRYNRR
jgi:hypothetical protein